MVKGHWRITKSGKEVWVKPHTRRNERRSIPARQKDIPVPPNLRDHLIQTVFEQKQYSKKLWANTRVLAETRRELENLSPMNPRYAKLSKRLKAIDKAQGKLLAEHGKRTMELAKYRQKGYDLRPIFKYVNEASPKLSGF